MSVVKEDQTVAIPAAGTGHAAQSKRRGGQFRLACVPLGLLLLAAAILKYSDSSWEPFGQVFTIPPAVQLALIEVEGAIGVWLLLGYAPRLLRYVAIGYFSLLAGASLAIVAWGVSSCGCFGQVTVPGPVVLPFPVV